MTLCHGDREMYDTMNHFLLLRPEEQILQIGALEQLVQKASQAMERGDPIVARVNLEIAARIEIYKGHKEIVRNLLEKAQNLRNMDEVQRRERTLLSNLDKAMTIAEEYYRKSPGQFETRRKSNTSKDLVKRLISKA